MTYFEKLLFCSINNLQVIWQLGRQLLYTIDISNTHTLFLLQRKINLVKYQNISKCYDHDCGFLTKIRFEI